MIAFIAAALISSIDPKAQVILEEAKAAAGGAAVDRIEPYESKSTLSLGNVKGTETYRCDPSRGIWSDERDLGLDSSAEGFDGSVRWRRDASGDEWPIGDSLDLLDARTSAYLCAFGYWYPARFPASIRLSKPDAGGDVVAGRATDLIVASVAGGVSALLYFDKQTHLLIAVDASWRAAAPYPLSARSDFRSFDGVLLPFRSSDEDRSGHVGWTRLVATIHSDAAVQSETAYRHKTLSDASIRSPGGTASVPMVSPEREIRLSPAARPVVVDVRLDGRGPFHFLLDSASRARLSTRAATELHLSKGDSLRMREYDLDSIARVHDVQIGAAHMRDAIFNVQPFFDASLPSVDGVIGFELFRRFVCSIDYGRRVVNLRLPSAFRAPAEGGVPLVFDGDAPEATMTIGARAGTFIVNTGSWPSVVVDDLWWADGNDQRFLNIMQSHDVIGWDLRLGGLTGALRSFDSVRLDGYTVRSPVGLIFNGVSGDFDDPLVGPSTVAGEIGDGMLSRFIVTVDFQTQRIYLENTPRVAGAETFDRAGLVWFFDKNRLVLFSVIDGSPAAAAGMDNGDELVAVNGTPALRLTEDQLMKAFRQPVGTHVRIVYKEFGGRTNAVTITLRDYLRSANL